MGFICLPHGEGSTWWYISPLTGSLIKSSSPPPGGGERPQKLNDALDCCEDPYSCDWDPEPSCVISDESLVRYEGALRWLGTRNFFLSFLYARWDVPLYKDTKSAFVAISRLHSFSNRRADQCFLRSLLAAKTSRSFAENGVLLIGAEISSGEMHAWIIENGAQPDHEDRSWINYRPLLAWIR